MKDAQSHSDTRGQFISNTEHMLERLRPALADATAKRRSLDGRMNELKNERLAALRHYVDNLVPDLTPRTLARLKTKCIGFVTRTLETEIAKAHEISVPFWTWVLGNSEKYKHTVRAERLAFVRVQLCSWLDLRHPRPEFMPDIVGLEEQIKTLSEQQRGLAEKETRLSAQIESLERVYRTYSRTTAPEPPTELREAVTKSSDQMRSVPQNAPTNGSYSGQDRGGMYIHDFLIPDSILNSGRHTEDHHYHEDGPSPHFDRPADHPRGNVDGGMDGGGGSSRLDVGDGDLDGGGGSTRMARADGDGGGSSRIEASPGSYS